MEIAAVGRYFFEVFVELCVGPVAHMQGSANSSDVLTVVLKIGRSSSDTV